MQIDEHELIARSKQSDADAYGQLVERYKSALYRHSFAILRDEDAAEDITQEAFIAAYYKLETFDVSKRFSTWLFRIATNKALNYLRAHKHTSQLGELSLERYVSPHPTPDQQAEYQELAAAIAALEPRYRAVLDLYYIEGMGYEDIAASMAKPVGSVKGWIHRAKNQLRKELS